MSTAQVTTAVTRIYYVRIPSRAFRRNSKQRRKLISPKAFEGDDAPRDQLCWSERINNRFIHVGVDTSRYALLIGGRSLYPPGVSQVTVSTFSVLVCVIWYMFSGYI